MRALVVLAALSGLSGCNGTNCATRDEVAVEDETDAGNPGLVALAERMLDAFYSDTGRDEICVDRVRVVESVGRDRRGVAGRYRPPPLGQSVQLGERGPAALDEFIATHELCHALDYTEGIRKEHRDTLASDIYEPVRQGYGRLSWVMETYAFHCGFGPRPPVGQVLQDHCDDLRPYGTPAQRVDEAVTWRGAFPDPTDTVPLEIRWSAISTREIVRGAWRAGRSVFVMTSPATTPDDTMTLRWIDDLSGAGSQVRVALAHGEYLIWPGEDRVLLVPRDLARPGWLVGRDGDIDLIRLHGADSAGMGAVSGDVAMGVVFAEDGQQMLGTVDLDAQPDGFEIIEHPKVDTVEPTSDGFALSLIDWWVLHGPPEGPFLRAHHGLTAHGADVPGGRAFRVRVMDTDGSERRVLMATTPDGQVGLAGCEHVDGFAANLGDEAVVVGIDGDMQIRIGHVTGL